MPDDVANDLEDQRPRSDLVAAYRRFGPALLRKAERILQNRDDAGDMVQQIFLELVHHRRGQLELPYLYRAVTTRCLNLLRDTANRQRLLERQQPALRGPVRTRCDDEVVGLDLLVKLAARLDRRALEVLLCRFWDDMTQDEIATFLGVSRRTVGKRLDQIRDRIGALVAGREEPR